MWVMSFNPYCKPVKQMLLISLCYRLGNLFFKISLLLEASLFNIHMHRYVHIYDYLFFLTQKSIL